MYVNSRKPWLARCLLGSWLSALICCSRPSVVERPVPCRLPYAVPEVPDLTWTICVPAVGLPAPMPCLSAADAAKLDLYIEDVLRWQDDYETLCKKED